MINIDPNTRFRDVARREVVAFDFHVNTIARLKKVKEKRALSRAEQDELDLSEEIREEIEKSQRNNSKIDEVCDPLFVATRTLLNEQSLIDDELRSHVDGVLVFEGSGAQLAANAPAQGQRFPITLVALTLGLLMADAAEAPPVKVVPQLSNQTGSFAAPPKKANGKTIYPNFAHQNAARFTKEFFRAIGEARSFGILAEKVLAIVAAEGDPDGRGGASPTVGAEEFAKVMRGLAKRKVGADEPQLRRRVNEVLDKLQNVGGEDEIADLNIDLPDLEEIFDENIVAENVLAMGPMIVSAMFEELKVFQVVDRIVEQFQQGTLPIGPGNAGKQLYKYWREAPNRMNEQERRNFAAITIGIPGGDPGAMVNREFNDLWLRFVSSVSSFIRQNEVDTLLQVGHAEPDQPPAGAQGRARPGVEPVAARLSAWPIYAARELQAQIKFMIELLQDPEILGSFGARDMWQVVDQVATYDLGGAKTSSRYRTLATCGTIITAWLANNVERINRDDRADHRHRGGPQPRCRGEQQGDQEPDRLRPRQCLRAVAGRHGDVGPPGRGDGPAARESPTMTSQADPDPGDRPRHARGSRRPRHRPRSWPAGNRRAMAMAATRVSDAAAAAIFRKGGLTMIFQSQREPMVGEGRAPAQVGGPRARHRRSVRAVARPVHADLPVSRPATRATATTR